MHAVDLFRLFEKQQHEAIRRIEMTLGEGKASDWEHYKKLVGEISGRRQAVSDFREAVKKLEQGNDDE